MTEKRLITNGMKLYIEKGEVEVDTFDGFSFLLKDGPIKYFGNIRAGDVFFDKELKESLFEEYKEENSIPVRWI